MVIALEQLQFEELRAFMREQANDAFPDLKDEHRLIMLAEKWCSHAEFCICRDDANQLVGMIAFYANQPEKGIVYIPHVYVHSKLRGKKLMTYMLDIIKEYVQAKGFQYLRLEVNKTNKKAQLAYLHYGFYPSGVMSNESFFMEYKI